MSTNVDVGGRLGGEGSGERRVRGKRRDELGPKGNPDYGSSAAIDHSLSVDMNGALPAELGTDLCSRRAQDPKYLW